MARMMGMIPAHWGISPLNPLMSSSTLVTPHRGAQAGPVPREEEEEGIPGLEMGTVAA